jgi:hypothetical protein
VECGFFDQSSNLFEPGYVDCVAGARNLDRVARVAYQRSGLMKEPTDRWVEFMPGVTATERKQNFFVIFSAMAGAVSIARLLNEPADKEKVLAGMRDHILHSF